MKKRKLVVKPRNPLHDHPLLRKGGVQEKSGKAKRRSEKVVLRKEWPVLDLLLSAVRKQAIFFVKGSRQRNAGLAPSSR